MFFKTRNNVGARNPAFQRGDTRFDLGDHATGNDAIFDQIAAAGNRYGRNQRLGIILIAQNTRDVGEEDQFFRACRNGNIPRRTIRVDIVKLPVDSV